MAAIFLDRLAASLASPVTRRTSLGLFTTAVLLGLDPRGDGVTARKRRRKRRKKRKDGSQPNRCLRAAQVCAPDRAPHCCDGLQCDQTVVDGVIGRVCCQPEGMTCSATSAAGCCSGTCDFLVAGGSCAPCRGRSCSAERPCCGGVECRNGYCGGCRDRATSCSSNTQCCFSNCTGGACLSALGGPCARDVDCRACYLNHQCTGACVQRTCTV